MVRGIILALSLLEAGSAISAAQSIPAPDIPEAGSVEAIAAATGDKHFLSPWVSYLPQSATVPSPCTFSGASRARRASLSTPQRPMPTAARLAAASPRVRVFTIGRSEEGRDIFCSPSPTKPAFANSIA